MRNAVQEEGVELTAQYCLGTGAEFRGRVREEVSLLKLIFQRKKRAAVLTVDISTTKSNKVLKPTGKYMYHLLQQSITLHFVLTSIALFSL
jgi:hypothetical protein